MKISNTPKEFNTAVNKLLFDFLDKDFKEYVFHTESEMVKKVVYSYRATDYAMHERRMDNGGLSDERNMDAIWINSSGENNLICYVNKTTPQEADYEGLPLSEAEAVEEGDRDWRMDKSETNPGPGPRPFTQETKHKIETSQKTYSVFKNYFNKIGIQTKNIK